MCVNLPLPGSRNRCSGWVKTPPSLESRKRRRIFGSGAISDKMLLVRIVENDKIFDKSGQVRLSKG